MSPLRGAGIAAEGSDDLEEVLTTSPDVVLVDPTGWESACRRTLEAFDTRPWSPPAVLFIGRDALVMHTAGPGYQFVPATATPRTQVAAINRAREAWCRFAPRWPSLLGGLPAGDLRRIRTGLRKTTGLEVRQERESTFRQAVRTRMVARLIPTAREYADVVQRNGDCDEEMELLAELLVVGETYFWRYAGQFHALQRFVLPKISRRGRNTAHRLRLWSAGCASGEEVYSLIMACLEALGAGWDVDVVGTDIHRPSLAHAEVGVYRERALRNLPKALRAKYFEPVSGGFRVSGVLRQRARFEYLNLGGDGVGAWCERHGPFDAIFCRNTLIYLHRASAERVVQALAAALPRDGGLFLGASENLLPTPTDVEPVRCAGSFFYRKRPPADSPAPDEPPETEDLEERRAAQWYEEGLACLDAEDFGGAKQLFEDILSLRPNDARGHTGLALLLANEGRETEASEHLERASQNGPVLPETQYLLGLVAERTGRDTAALQHYRKALETDPEWVMARVNRAWLLRRQGRSEAFLEEMRSALHILKRGSRVPPWISGGVRWEALLQLITEALEEEAC